MPADTAPAFVFLSEAEKLANVSRRTLDRDIRSGKIHNTQVRRSRNRKKVSVAELERVYGQLHLQTETRQDNSPAMSQTQQDIVAILKEQLAEEKARSRRAEEQAQEWQERYLGAQEKLNGFLLPPPPEEKNKGRFRNWFNKKN
jgi:hypothetical protein